MEKIRRRNQDLNDTFVLSACWFFVSALSSICLNIFVDSSVVKQVIWIIF